MTSKISSYALRQWAMRWCRSRGSGELFDSRGSALRSFARVFTTARYLSGSCFVWWAASSSMTSHGTATLVVAGLPRLVDDVGP
ncbi:hypothetical protein ACIQOF_38700 [Streptomyces sp. NPDC091265]|uniref:hypothetical protein n=1 Tax=unclassified Streptomyces TaxID=2593676 RepID=UPI00344FF97A